MQFVRHLRDRVRSGEVTCSIRLWHSPRVRLGGRYALAPGHITVTRLREIALSDVTPALARRSGFAGVVDLLKVAKHGSGRRVFLVEFQYQGPKEIRRDDGDAEDRHRRARSRGGGSEALSGGRTTRRVPIDLRGLGGRAEIFRIAPGRRRDPAVERWLGEGGHELRAIARTWFERMRRCGDDVVELVHDGCPVACVGDAPFAYVNVFRSHVNVGFYNGAALADPSALLQGSGRHMRHVKLKPGEEPDVAALGALIEAAYADLEARLDAFG